VREENKDAVLLREDVGETFLSSPSLAFEIERTRLSENINDVIAVMQLRARRERKRKRQREREREREREKKDNYTSNCPAWFISGSFLAHEIL